ncbi:MAG: integrase family protein, partial [Acidobacteria bacterium]|nr:integrase family protein [Acidobacteriota bacterium]
MRLTVRRLGGKTAIMRQTGTTTRYPGVFRVSDRVYRIRAKSIDARTGKVKQAERLLEGVSAPEAAKVRSELVEELRSGGVVNSGARLRVGDFAISWTKAKLQTVDRATGERYVDALENHVLPSLGDFFCDALRPTDVQEW